jgi:hypothetical protein
VAFAGHLGEHGGEVGVPQHRGLPEHVVEGAKGIITNCGGGQAGIATVIKVMSEFLASRN